MTISSVILRRSLTIIAGILATVSAILILLMIFVYSQFDGEGKGSAECAIVFGAAVHKNSQPGPGILRRTKTATRLYHEGKVDMLFLSGGKGSPTLDSEAEVMRRVAIEQGVNPDDIIIEGDSRSTWENLANTKRKRSACTNVLRISDRYHLARIGYSAYLQNISDLQLVPADRHANTFFEFKSVLRESLGIIYYFLISF